MSLMDRIDLVIVTIVCAFFFLYFWFTGDFVGAITGMVYGLIPLVVTALQFASGIPVLVIIVIIAYLVLKSIK